ncbi:sensor histidine kinase [Nostocoides jenkinsii]|uniref:histidine kinase n=1 Tax=Nostocoides jenkinsii Ben 74 TaxID=1193518 RepID=A0A077MBI1_9MICO|nr:ATP-binding protein [Tetrasphaera jenkinsii]CCI52008.1 membrane hypothetical protein [Tetrasphaera jenkinsii Ben 74]
MTTRPTREELVLAGAGLVWVVAGLWRTPGVAATVGAGVSAGLLVSRQRPQVAAALVLAAAALAPVLGVPSESPATLLPVVVAIYGLGRWAGRTAAITGGAAFVVPVAWSDGWSWPTLLFTLFLYGVCWGFGRVVAAKAAGAERERAVADRAQAQDPDHLVAAVVAAERTRLAADITEVVGACVGEMATGAELAQTDLSAHRIETIRRRGAMGVTELRRLLGLLRERTGPEDLTDPTPGRAAHALGLPIRDLVASVVLVVVTVAGLVGGGQPPQRATLVLLALLPFTLLLRRDQNSLAMLLAAAVIALVDLIQPVSLGAGPALVVMILSWSAAADGRRSVWGCWMVLLATGIVTGARNDPDNVAMLGLLAALSAWAGHAWTDSDHRERVAHDRMVAAQSLVEAAVVEAVRAERLRIARDLHDVTSHALGVMVVQAGAAAAQRDRDPERARASLAVVAAAGRHAALDIDRLARLIEAGALGAPDGQLHHDQPIDLADRLRGLAERVGRAGLELTLNVLPAHPATTPPADDRGAPESAVDLVVYRVVQESLTNAIRHAPGSRVQVTVVARAADWQVQVLDDGGDGVAAAVPGAGFGLAGVAERVRDLGGRLTAGTTPDRGWSVAATIPRHRTVPAAGDVSDSS